MDQLSWDDLKLFLAMVRGGTIRGAAKILNTSHSTVARRMERLSEVAGATLIERGTDGLRLTVTGEDMLRTAERMEEEVTALERRSFGLDKALKGTIVLATLDALMVEPMLSMLDGFVKRHPEVDLRLHVSLSLASLDRREADLALRFGTNPDDHLVGRSLMQTARAVYAAPDYQMGPETGWISFSAEGRPETWKQATPYPDLPTRLRIDDMRTQQAAACAGLGLTLLPCFLCDPDPGLVRVSEPDFPPFQQLWLLRHADARSNARVSALVDHIVAGMRGMAPLLTGQTGQTVLLGSGSAST